MTTIKVDDKGGRGRVINVKNHITSDEIHEGAYRHILSFGISYTF